jgi:hypothetical protein
MLSGPSCHKMEAAGFSETLVPVGQATRRDIPEGRYLYSVKSVGSNSVLRMITCTENTVWRIWILSFLFIWVIGSNRLNIWDWCSVVKWSLKLRKCGHEHVHISTSMFFFCFGIFYFIMIYFVFVFFLFFCIVFPLFVLLLHVSSSFSARFCFSWTTELLTILSDLTFLNHSNYYIVVLVLNCCIFSFHYFSVYKCI